MTLFNQRVSLKINRPRVSVAAYGTVLFALACIMGEMVARTPFVQSQVPYQAYGMNHAQLELQLNLLNKFVQENGAPDCFIFGSSQAFREVDPTIFTQAYAAAGEEPLTCYNFGVTGSQVWTTSILNKILIQEYQPRLVIIGTSFLDYTEGRENRIDERFKDSDWLKYKTGTFTLGGWLTEYSYAWRALTLLSYTAPYGLVRDEVLREAHKWDRGIANNGFAVSEKSTNPNEPVEKGFIKNLEDELGNFSISERNLSALEETIVFSQEAGAQVLIAEMTYHPALLELKDGKGTPRVDKENMLAFIGQVNTRLQAIATRRNVRFLAFDPAVAFPPSGWYDLYHLNRIGAKNYSQWLGEQAARVLAPLPPAQPSEGN